MYKFKVLYLRLICFFTACSLMLSFISFSVNSFEVFQIDDFNSYANSELIKQHESDTEPFAEIIEQSKIVNQIFDEKEQDIALKYKDFKEKTDESQLATFLSCVYDVEQRNKQAIEPLKPYFNQIETISSINDFNKTLDSLNEKKFFYLTASTSDGYENYSSYTLSQNDISAIKKACLNVWPDEQTCEKIINVVTQMPGWVKRFDVLPTILINSISSPGDQAKLENFNLEDLKNYLKVSLYLNSILFLDETTSREFMSCFEGGNEVGWKDYVQRFSGMSNLILLQEIIKDFKIQDESIRKMIDNKDQMITYLQESICKKIDAMQLSDKAKTDIKSTIQNVTVLILGVDDYKALFYELELKDLCFKGYSEGGSFLENILIARAYDEKANRLIYKEEKIENINSIAKASGFFETCENIYAHSALSISMVEPEKFDIIFASGSIMIDALMNNHGINNQVSVFLYTIGHELGHQIGQYTPMENESAVYRSVGTEDRGTIKNTNEYNQYKKAVLKSFNQQVKDEQIMLSQEDKKYFNNIAQDIINYFENINLGLFYNDNTPAVMNGKAVYSEVFADIWGLESTIDVAKILEIDIGIVFLSFAKIHFNTNRNLKQLNIAGYCAYPFPPYRINGVLHFIPEYQDWAAKQNKLIPEKLYEQMDKKPIAKIFEDDQTDIKMYFTEQTCKKNLNIKINKTNMNSKNYLIYDKDKNEKFNVEISDSEGNLIEDFDGDIAVLFPVSDNLEKRENLSLYWLDVNKTEQKINSDTDIVTVDNKDYYLFKTSHFISERLNDNNIKFLVLGIIIFGVVLSGIVSFFIIKHKKIKN